MNKKIIIAISVAFLVIACVFIVFFSKSKSPETSADTSSADAGLGPANAQTGISDILNISAGESDIINDTANDTINEADMFAEEESKTTEPVKIYTDENIGDLSFLFESEKESIYDGVLGMVENRDMKALTVEFDNMIIKPGMKVSDIIDTSHWYTAREFDILEPGEAGYLILENDFWTNDEIKLNDDKDARNGDVILWVHNYNDVASEMRDCVIYKYQISYLGCDNFYERPILKYMDEYELGKNEFPNISNSAQSITTDRGPCIRYQYGDVSSCMVFLDKDDTGLIGITVSYNEYYGPDFNGKE